MDQGARWRQGAAVALSVVAGDGPRRILDAFQRDARAALEQLLPFLHRPGLYPDALVEGWGDLRGGRPTASTVILVSPKASKPPERTKELGRLRLEVSDQSEWTAIVTVAGQPDERCAWPPVAEAAWWVDLPEKLRAQLLEYRRRRGHDAIAHPALTGPEASDEEARRSVRR